MVTGPPTPGPAAQGQLLQGRVAVVTGGGGGIGGAISTLFAEHGAHVVIVDSDSKRATETRHHIEEAGGAATALAFDVSLADTAAEVHAAVIASHGRVDVLVNNVGHYLPRSGDFASSREQDWQGLYEINEVLEKPTPTVAEQQLVVPGLRAGFYLCFFGMHVLGPEILALLDEQQAAAPDRALGLSPALHALASRRRYLALSIAGRRYDIGAPYGLLFAQLAMSLAGRDRDRVLTQLVELVAVRADRA